MAHILIMPRQGNTVESCIITNWKVKEGDSVTPETTICEVETDKAAFEIPAGAAGTVLKLLFTAGDDVPVLKPIAVIGAAGEDWSDILTSTAILGDNTQETSRRGANAQREEGIKEAGSDSVLPTPYSLLPTPHSPISPRARNLAEKEALSLDTMPGTGPGGRIIERDVMAALQDKPLLTAAAKAAEPVTVPTMGSGIGGRVTVADLASSSFSADHSQLPTPYSLPSAEGAITETPIKGIRKIIADRMFKSLAESAQFTLNASASAFKLQEIRSAIKTRAGFAEELGLSKITINDLVLFAVSRTLPRFPFMNAHKTGETIRVFERVHLAVAVDTPRGLMVPVIRNANLLSLAQISSEAKRLAAACQNGAANPDELSGSTFTVSNLGSFGITGFTPVLNAPEVAILGVCGIELKPVALADNDADDCNCGVGFEPQIGFSLTINHQAVDGAPAAKFLKALGEAVAHIDLLLAAG
jgi:pyruvate dehydrogenase E2 component (dihydrolipoamide acetyltransferase)